MLPSVAEAGRLGYSQGVRVGNVVYVSGQVALDSDGNVVGKGDFAAQTRRVFENLRSVLKSVGGDLDDIVRIKIHLTDMDNLDEFRRIRSEYFRDWFPASTLIEVGGLIIKELMIEIDAIAVVEK